VERRNFSFPFFFSALGGGSFKGSFEGNFLIA
jgi:hypothetical protein